MRHALLLDAALRQSQHDVVALPLMKAFLPANPHHGSRIGTVGAAAQRNLIHDRRAVDQPADGADIGPGGRRVVEYARILGLTRQQLIDQLIAAHAESLGGAVQVGAVATLVLHLGDQNGLAQQGRRARDPISLRQHADDLGMGVLRDLANQRGAVSRGHPVLRLDLLFAIDARLEVPLARYIIGRRGRIGPLNIERLRVHAASRPAVATVEQDQTDTYIASNQFFLCHKLLHTAIPLRTPNRPAVAARNLVKRFGNQRPLRAGSLIVTIFGDSIMPRGGAISLGSLIQLAAPFGLNERLVRTATARLAHEGWVQARRVGKLSEYRLSGARTRALRRGHSAHLRRVECALVGTLDPGRVARHARCGAASAAQGTDMAGVWRVGERRVRTPRQAGAWRRIAVGRRRFVRCADLRGATRRARSARLGWCDLGWDLVDLAKRYRRFVRRFEPAAAALRVQPVDPASGFRPAHPAHPRVSPPASARSSLAQAIAARELAGASRRATVPRDLRAGVRCLGMPSIVGSGSARRRLAAARPVRHAALRGPQAHCSSAFTTCVRNAFA